MGAFDLLGVMASPSPPSPKRQIHVSSQINLRPSSLSEISQFSGHGMLSSLHPTRAGSPGSHLAWRWLRFTLSRAGLWGLRICRSRDLQDQRMCRSRKGSPARAGRGRGLQGEQALPADSLKLEHEDLSGRGCQSRSQQGEWSCSNGY